MASGMIVGFATGAGGVGATVLGSSPTTWGSASRALDFSPATGGVRHLAGVPKALKQENP